MATKLPGVEAKTAAEIAAHFEMSDEGAAVLKPKMTPAEAHDALVAAGQLRDAISLLAHGLGRREAVWWACVCTKLTLEPSPPPGYAAALAAAEAWCYRPTEPNRRAAGDAAQATPMKHPGGWAGIAAFWSGGSMAPASAPQPVPPGPFLTAKAVVTALTLAAVRSQPEKAQEKFAKFLAKGVEIANAPAADPKKGA